MIDIPHNEKKDFAIRFTTFDAEKPKEIFKNFDVVLQSENYEYHNIGEEIGNDIKYSINQLDLVISEEDITKILFTLVLLDIPSSSVLNPIELSETASKEHPPFIVLLFIKSPNDEEPLDIWNWLKKHAFEENKYKAFYIDPEKVLPDKTEEEILEETKEN